MYDLDVNRKTTTPPDDCRETTGRLLDTAEKLFAEYGYDGVGMRALAEEAKVNLGATTYHYGSKQALYIETFMRRFRPTNAERLRLLREAEAASRGKPLPVEKIVECLLRPPFLLELNHPHFHALLARNLFMPPAFLYPVLHKEIQAQHGGLYRGTGQVPAGGAAGLGPPARHVFHGRAVSLVRPSWKKSRGGEAETHRGHPPGTGALRFRRFAERPGHCA